MKKMIPIIIIVLALVLGAVYFFFLRGEPPVKYTTYSPGDYFVTNVKGTNRLFKTAVILVLDTDKLEEKLTENQARIRDTIIFILRDQEEAVFQDTSGQDKLRTLIKSRVDEALALEGHVVDVLFSDYVMQ